MSAVDLKPITDTVVNGVAAVAMTLITGGLGLLAVKAKQWFNLQIDKATQDKITAIAQQELMKGVVASKDEIEAKGWDHIDVHNAVAAAAIQGADAALAAHGLDNSDPATIQKMQTAIQAQLPGVFTAAAASPATPAEPEKPPQVVVVPPPALPA